MKKILIALAFLGLLASAIFAFYTFNLFIYGEKQEAGEPINMHEKTTKSSQDESQALVTAIKNALVEKYGPSAATLTVSVTEISGDYAKGEASETGVGGGIWFAAKVSGTWEIVYDGNGIITCDVLNDYQHFPNDLIPSCYDQQKGELVTR